MKQLCSFIYPLSFILCADFNCALVKIYLLQECRTWHSCQLVKDFTLKKKINDMYDRVLQTKLWI